ncbi:hypothetical protein DSO57_1021342 [Entomophthora muscae]|uniref:Uncharacterized protein n=1 Tax=Entomophthora muscae TaxID=34485 RepID=A0ACC2SSB5_9FUNG|nr:hypothetical protein DSO57_1021342 [Entomophthora muscae]
MAPSYVKPKSSLSLSNRSLRSSTLAKGSASKFSKQPSVVIAKSLSSASPKDVSEDSQQASSELRACKKKRTNASASKKIYHSSDEDQEIAEEIYPSDESSDDAFKSNTIFPGLKRKKICVHKPKG